MRMLIMICLLVACGVGYGQDLEGYHTFDASTATQSIGELSLKKTIPLRNGDYLLVGSHAFNSQERDGFVFRISPTGQRIASYYVGGANDDEIIDAVEANGSIYILVDFNQNTLLGRRAQIRRLTNSLSFTGAIATLAIDTGIGQEYTIPIAIDVFPSGELVVAFQDAGGFVIGIPGATWAGASLISVSANLSVDYSSKINVADRMNDIFVRGNNVLAVGSSSSIDVCSEGEELTTYSRNIYVAEYSATLSFLQGTNYETGSTDGVIDAVLHDNGNIGIIGSTTCFSGSGLYGPNNVGANNFGVVPHYWLIDFEDHNGIDRVREINGNEFSSTWSYPRSVAPADCGQGHYLVLNNDFVLDLFQGVTSSSVVIHRYDPASFNGEVLYDEETTLLLPDQITKSAISRSFVLGSIDRAVGNEPLGGEAAIYRFSSEGCANPDWCEDAEPWPCDASYNHTTEGYTSTLSIDDYTCYTSPAGSEFDGADRIYAIDHPGGIFSVTLTSTGLDFDLFMFDDCFEPLGLAGESETSCIRRSVNGLDESGQNFDNISEPNLPSGRYYIVVDAPNGLIQGPYQIDFRCCTIESFLCDNQYVVPFGGSSYQFVATDGEFSSIQPWTINGIPATDFSEVATTINGNVLECDFSSPGNYQICYFVNDPESDGECAGFYCCRDYCIDFNDGPGDILQSYNAQNQRFNFELDVSGFPSEATWFDVDFPQNPIGTGASINVSIPDGSCQEMTLFVRYFDTASECYRTVRRVFWLCDPFACGDIDYTFTDDDGYLLELTGVSDAQDLSWQDDATGEIIGSGFSTFIPINGNCGYRDFSVRYRIGDVWRICCIRVYICDPFQCGLLTEQYLDNNGGGGYLLTYDGPDIDTYTWTDDLTLQTLPGSGNNIFLPFDGNCRTRNISVRFYDPVLNRWRICCLSFEFCPDTCPPPTDSFSPSCGTQQFIQYDFALNNTFNFSSPNGGDVGEWKINGTVVTELDYAFISSANTLDVSFPTEGNYEVCYPVFDGDGCFDYCCREYCIDFNPPAVPTTFEVADNGNGYVLTFSEAGATDISWYNASGPGEGVGPIVFIEFPTEVCGYRNYYFRYRSADGCWKTARRRMYICNPFNCVDVDYTYDRINEEWDLTFNGDGGSITWIDDDNNGNELDSNTPFLSIDPRPGGSCGYRNISVRYFDGVGWRFCCLRFWDCDPYDCGNFTTFNNEVTEALQLSFNGANASQITWQDDATGQALPNSNGATVVPLPWPGEGCQTRYISVRYFDTVLGVFRICCIEVEVCRPQECDPPLFLDCNDQEYYQLADGGYRIFTDNPGFAPESEWYIGNFPASQAGFEVQQQGSVITCYFPSPGTYLVCYPYYDAFGCLQYCCQEYCIDEEPSLELTDFSLDSDGNQYALSLEVVGASGAQWYYLDGGVVDLPGGPIVILPVPEECYTRTFYCRYRDASGCWRVVFRRVTICDPATCGTISYAFNVGQNAFALTLEAANATNITWFDDDNNIELPFSSPTVTVVLEAECGPRNFSVRYFDGTAWRFCCLRYDACNPYTCNLIVPVYDEESEQFTLTLDEAEGLEQLSWSDDDDPAVNFTSTGPALSIPVTGPCRRRNISIRYYDPVSGLWGICCVSYWQCLPDACGTVFTDREIGENLVELAVPNTFTDVSWQVGGAAAGSGNSIEAVIVEGQTRRVCVRYFDPMLGYWRTCCREVINPDCDLPLPTFTSQLITLDSVQLSNTNVVVGETYVWSVDGAFLTDLAPQQTLHLPPGPHEICLRAINDCGPQTVCRTIIIPDPAVDLIFDIDEGVCGQPGEVIDVPLRVQNFTEVDAFQFTIRLGNPRVGKLVGADYQLAAGTFNFATINDSTVALLWTQSGPGSGTLPDSTILANVRVELLGTPMGTGSITFNDEPTEPFYGLINGQTGVPALVNGSYDICLADAVLSGSVRKTTGVGVGLVDVALVQNGTTLQTMTTDITGTYSFAGLTPGQSYTIVPLKDINHRNGVNAGDMSSIRRHIFGQALLTSPYQRIAANPINFQSIEATDVSQLRQLIFQQIPRFSQVDSWHFVPTAYQFPDPDNPLMPAYPMEISLVAASGANENLDFIAIKMGDINEGAQPGQLTSNSESSNRAASDLKFSAVSDAPRRDGIYRVDILTEDFTEMVAAQFSVNWNPEVLRFDSVANLSSDLSLSELNFSFERTNDGQLPWLWFGEGQGTIPDSSVVFSLYYTVVGEGGAIAEISFTEEPTVFYFEDTEGEVLAQFTEISAEVLFPVSLDERLNRYQIKIVPNPAISVFYLEGGDGDPLEKVRLLDVQGRQIKVWEGSFPLEGFNVTDLASGVYLLELQTAGGHQVERLVVQR